MVSVIRRNIMTEKSKVKLIKALDVTELSGEKVMIDFSTGKYFVLVGSGNDIWDMLGSEPISVAQIKSNLLDIYDVDEATCLKETMTFLDKMNSNGFIEVID